MTRKGYGTFAADGVGLLTGAALLLLALNLIPFLHLELQWQVAAVVVLSAINRVSWRSMSVAGISFPEAAKRVGWCALFLGVFAVVDTAAGFFIGGKRSIVEAFFSSGPLGGITDLFLTVGAVFVGIPAMLRGLYLYYHGGRGI
jgi:hypothetical protein